jgi:hypothetical protein
LASNPWHVNSTAPQPVTLAPRRALAGIAQNHYRTIYPNECRLS